MSLLHLDFPSGQTGLYGTNTSYMLNGRYAEVTNCTITEDPDPSITGNVLAFSGSSGRFRYVLPSSVSTLGFACRLYFPSLPVLTTNLPNPFIARNGSNSDMFTVRIETDGRISAYRGSGTGTLLGTSTSPVMVTGAWQHFEVKVFLDGAAGTVEVRVEGVTVLSLTGQNTLGATGPCTQTAHLTNNTFLYHMKDIAVWDTNGSLNNNFLGSVAVYELIPNGDVANTWGLSTGSTGYTLVDEAPPNDDTDYIYAVSPAPAADKMSLTDLPVDVTSVKGLIAIVRSKKTDGGDGNLQIGMISGASTGLGTDRPITTAYTYWQDVFEVDPATGVAWTRVGVNAANIQFNRTL